MSQEPGRSAVLDELRAAFGADEVLAGNASPRHLKDWSTASGGTPLAILRPRSTAELSRMLAICNTHGQAVVPQGGLTGLVGGAVPGEGQVVVSLERMNAIEEIDLGSGTVTVQAGAVLQTLQEACHEAGALLAIDLGARGSCQIGGNVSTNAGGNRVIRYGNTRESVLGLGLQRIASNYVSGFIILLDRSIRLGNLVAIDDKTTGTVTRITTRYTVLRMLSGTEVIIPNEYLVGNLVRNLSFSDNRIRVATTVGVAYDTDIERAMQLMIGVARAHPRVLADPGPGVLLTDFADSSIMLELGFWVGDPELGTGGVRSDINLEILRVFRREGIAIPFPQREVRVLSDAQGTMCPNRGTSSAASA